MFATLPDTLQQQILSYLEAADFKAAKELRDNYLLHGNRQIVNGDQENLSDF